ncbi:hypothetical protein BHM03_00047593 [Ensete ventricosum]|nr:hypothetical protein BHM03_00047593 [Ensete ventricosum]
MTASATTSDGGSRLLRLSPSRSPTATGQRRGGFTTPWRRSGGYERSTGGAKACRNPPRAASPRRTSSTRRCRWWRCSLMFALLHDDVMRCYHIDMPRKVTNTVPLVIGFLFSVLFVVFPWRKRCCPYT